MTANKSTRPRVGDESWIVEWIYERAWEGEGEDRSIDFHNCKEACCRVATREEAEATAREVWPQSDGGLVVRYRLERYTRFGWDGIGDYEEYEGPDEQLGA